MQPDGLEGKTSFYFRAFHGSPIAMSVTTLAEGQFLECNQAFLDLFGYRREELLGEFVESTAIWPNPDDRPKLVKMLQEQGNLKSDSIQLQTKVGKALVVYLSWELVNYESRPAIFTVIYDTTEKSLAEEALRESEVRLRTIIESEPECVKLIGRDGLILDMNRAGLAMLEADVPEQVIGKSAGSFVLPEYRKGFQDLAEDVFRGKSGAIQFEAQGLKGSRRWLESHAGPLRNQKGEVFALLGITRDITGRREAEKALRENEERFRTLFENANDLIFTLDLDGSVTSLNKSMARISGYTSEGKPSTNISQILSPQDFQVLKKLIDGRIANLSVPNVLEVELIANDGRKIPAEVSIQLVEKDARPVGIQIIARDMTERKQLENQLRHAQRLEAVGRLAGGVAHDFNNMLTAIIGYSDDVLTRLPADDPLRTEIAEIKSAGERAAGLTRQLLAFSRKQRLSPQIISINDVVTEMKTMVQRLIGENIRLEIHAGDRVGFIKADPSQIQQVIMNLAINSRDSMPDGGRLLIETSDVDLEESFTITHTGSRPGKYLLLAVSDTGTGIASDVLPHIFEPFYTTKAQGKGTGLGLATVYGIVKQSGGYIYVDSTPAQGTIFSIYLPRQEEVEAAVAAEEAVADSASTSATVLLVEDEDSVRSLARTILRRQGYTVLEARQGEEALMISDQHQGPIDLILTDVVMPKMSGCELVDLLVPRRPEMRVMYMSGYAADSVLRLDSSAQSASFLTKPFAPSALVRRVREVLSMNRAQPSK